MNSKLEKNLGKLEKKIDVFLTSEKNNGFKALCICRTIHDGHTFVKINRNREKLIKKGNFSFAGNSDN